MLQLRCPWFGVVGSVGLHMVWAHCPFPVNTTLFTDQSSILACAAYGLRGHGKHSRVDFPQSTVPFLRAESNLCWQMLPLPCSSGSELSLFPSSLKNSSACEPMLSQAQLEGVKLMSKFTFIDVVEQSPSLRRSASMPARSTHPRSLAQRTATWQGSWRRPGVLSPSRTGL